MLRRLAALALLLTTPLTAAPAGAQVVQLTYECVTGAARAFGHSPQELWALLAVEGGKVGECVTNRNGTRDCGPFQINSIWAPRLADTLNLPVAEVERLLRDDGCVSAYVAAWILHQAITEAGGDRRLGLGYYHSHTPTRRDIYQRRVDDALHRLFPDTR